MDDGSSDNTYEIAQKKGCIALRHMINRGKGAGTQTGLDAAKLLNAAFVITMDGDGQHIPSDISLLLNPLISKKCDVVLGSRLLEKKGMPFSKHLINVVGNLITYLFYGIYVSDSQSGLRAYTNSALRYIDTSMDRYEFESEILQQVKAAGLKYTEVPIHVRYTTHSKTKYLHLKNFERQRFINGIKMVFKMMIRSLFS